jgi:hypothetical protein
MTPAARKLQARRQIRGPANETARTKSSYSRAHKGSVSSRCSISANIEDPFPISGAFAPGAAGAADLEIDALGKPLNELPPFRERGPAGEGRRHAGTINLRDDADRADDMPDEPATAGDHKGAAVWRRVAGAAETLANTTPSGPVH